jgi:polyisoprenoid-binding protein YceI
MSAIPRHTLTFASALLAAAALSPVGAAEPPLTLDPAHSSAEFAVQHLVLTTVKGTFKIASLDLITQTGSPIPKSVTATLDASSVDTKEPDRDKDLRGPNWFDSTTYPTITFKSVKIVTGADPKHFSIGGQLTLHGVTKPVVLDATYGGEVVDGRGKRHYGYNATTTIDRRDFGLSWARSMPDGTAIVGSDVKIDLQIELVR